MGKRWLLSVSTALVLAGAAACGGADDPTGAAGADQQDQQQASPAAAPEPDLDGIPEVVAEVNGEPIAKDEFVQVYRAQFAQLTEQAQTSGEPVDQEKLKKDLLDAIIGAELLSQEAERREYPASDADVEEALTRAAEENGVGSVEEFLAAVEAQGTTAETVRSEFRSQVRVDQLLAEEGGDFEVTDAEVEQLYDEVAEQAAGPDAPPGAESQLPPLEELRPRLEQQLRSEKESEIAQKLIRTYREDADVTVNI